LELLVSAGLTPIEALRAATSVPASRFSLPERGRAAKGMRADLVLVDGDATTDVTRTRTIAAIYKNGRFVARERWDPAAHAAAPLAAGKLGDLEDGLGTRWQETTDKLRGGASTVSLAVADGGARGTAKALRVTGAVKEGFPFPWAGAICLPGTPAFSPV